MLVIENIVEELRKNPKAAIYVGGTLERYPSITMTARFLSLFVETTVLHACSDKETTFIDDIDKTYNHIRNANFAIFIPYADGHLNRDTIHEIVFARHTDTQTYILSSEDLKCIFNCLNSDYVYWPSSILKYAVKQLLKD